MSRFDTGATALISRMKASAGRVVTYTRPSTGQTVSMTVWVGNTLFSRTTKDVGANVIWGDRDYLFAVADLILGGVQVTPVKGDRITETIAGVATTFELQTPTGEPPWRYSDQLRYIHRWHCKRASP